MPSTQHASPPSPAAKEVAAAAGPAIAADGSRPRPGATDANGSRAGATHAPAASRRVDLDALRLLKRTLPDRVALPTDERYDAARSGFSLTNLPSPDAVVVAESLHDIVVAVELAHATLMPIAVHGTGHNFAFPYQGGILINTSQLRQVTFDDDRKTVRVGAGARWKDVLPGAAARGLAPLSGSSPEVGVVGYALHGGIGWLARKYGAAAHSIVAAEIITADGELVRADEHQNADLLWALRGGGGNFGAVVALELQLYPVASVYGGSLVFPLARAREVLSAWREWTATVPDEMTSSTTLVRLPNAPSVPERMRGGRFAIVRACWLGDESSGSDRLKPLRALDGLALDTFRTMSYAETGEITNDPANPSRSWRKNMTLATLTDEATEVLVRLAGDAAPSPLSVVELRHLGGALRNSAYGSFGSRAAEFAVHIIGSLASPAGPDEVKRYAAMLAAALAEHADGGLLPGFLGDGDTGTERMRAGYSEADWERLQELKRRYDPANLFRLTHALAR